MWRRSFIVLAVFCGILAGVLIALQSRRVADNVEAYLARIAHERFGVTLTIDHLEVELVPPGIAVRGVEVRRPDLDAPWATLYRGRVLIRPWPSAAGSLVIHHIELDGLEGSLDLRGQDGLLSREEGRGRIPIDIREMLIWNANIALHTDENSFAAQRSDFQLSPRPGGRTLEITLGEAIWIARHGSSAGLPVPFELAARARLRGSLDRPEELTVERAILALEATTVTANGGVSFARGGDLDIRVEAQAPLTAVAALLASDLAVGGTAECQLEVTGSPLSPRSSAQLALRGFELVGTHLGDIDLHAVHQRERVNVEAFRVSHRDAGTVTGSGSVDLTGEIPITLVARTHRASLPEVLELVGVTNSWVPLDLNADLHGSGTLKPFRLQLDMDGEIARFAVHDRGFREVDPAKILEIQPIEIDGDFAINPWAVDVQEIRLAWGELSGLAVSGSLRFDRTMDLRASGDMVDLAEIGAIAGVHFSGYGALAATVEGPMHLPVVSGTIEMSDFGVEDHFLGDTKATIIYTSDDHQLAVDRAVVRRRRGTMKASGAISFAEKDTRANARANLDDIDVSDLLVSVGLDATLADRIHARVDGRVDLAGRLAAPAGTVELAGPNLRVDGTPLGTVSMAGGFGGAEELLWGTIEVTPEKGSRLSARAAHRKDATMTLTADASAVPLALLQPFVPGTSIEGRLSGDARLSGPPAALSGKVNAVLSELAVAGVRLETTRLRAGLDRGAMTIGGTALGGAARVDAHLELGQRIPYTATATFQDLLLARLVDLPEEIGVTMTGALFSQGDMTRPSSIVADARLDSARLTWGDLSLQAMRPVRLQYASHTVRVDDLVLSGARTQVSAAGTLSPTRGLDLIVSGYGDLRPTGGVRSDLEWLRGRFEVSSRVQGTWDAPRLSGDASLRNAALKLPGTGEILDAIEANVKLSGRTITLASANAQLGGGQVTAGGRLLLPMQGESDVNLRANLTRVSVRPQPELHAVASGHLSLLGPFDDLLLHGRLQIESLRYSKNFVLDRLLPRRNAPPIKVPALGAHQGVRLAVGLHAPGNVIISNNVLDSELRADLTVTGTSERIGLIGSLTPLRAKAHYRDNVFVVERAAIDFSEEFRIYTQFDLRATTEACDMEITVDVHGNPDRYNVAPRGQDENGEVDPEDVLTCLQFGIRGQEFRDQLSATEDTGSEDTTSPFSNPVVPIGLDLAWTVSGMDEKVRRLLPIELDEVRLESGWSSHYRRTTTRVLVGKELSDRLQLRYSRSIDDIDDQTLSFEYQLSDIAALEGSWLSASNVSVGDLGLDLRLRWEFR